MAKEEEPEADEKLEISNKTEFIIQVARPNWTSVFWHVFKATLAPWSDDKARIDNGKIAFSNSDTAEKAARAIKEKYPEERLRVVWRHAIVQEQLEVEIE